MRISDWSSDVCSSDLVTHVLHHVARLRHRAEPAVAERTDQRLQIGFVDRRCGIAEREPFAVAFVHFLPVVELVRDGEREDFDIIHDRRAVREIGRAHVWTPVTNAPLVCRLLLDKKQNYTTEN